MPVVAASRLRELEAAEGRRQVVLHDIGWATYTALLRDIGDGHARLTYDDGELEVSYPDGVHEKYRAVIGAMIGVLSMDLDVPISSFGSMTLRDERRRQGVEPDECYYVRNEPKVRGRTKLDPKRDPPPDLVVEVDITSHSIAKEPIYAALGVPEVWRFDGARFEFLHRTPDGTYAARGASLAFPILTATDVDRFVRRLPRSDETSVMRAWRDWLRKASR